MKTFDELLKIANDNMQRKEAGKPVLKWKQYTLKNRNSEAPYHYRRNGRLYVVLKDIQGQIIHQIQKLEYPTQKNTENTLSRKITKGATNPALQVELTASHLAYVKYNKTADKSA
tara:strand:+ start:403 stop:747 length:345 start_codon:yes stop_codon:yes gene_type:complete